MMTVEARINLLEGTPTIALNPSPTAEVFRRGTLTANVNQRSCPSAACASQGLYRAGQRIVVHRHTCAIYNPGQGEYCLVADTGRLTIWIASAYVRWDD